MTPLDWILAGVLVFSLLLGAWRGLVYEVLSVLGWAASFYAAQWFAPQVALLLPWQSASEPVRYAAAFALVFIAAVFVAGLLAALLKSLVEAIGLRPVDRTLGAAFGVLRGMILLLAATVVIDMTALQSSAWWQESIGAQTLTATLADLKPMLPGQFAKYLD
ncbi:CvpA family protein [Polaromonas naphthalenivorans]|uniref:Colicin V production protein n=1 Tax=Polaromonas naphthalenivorans (strain CJ2) TaxID=365044 RepID=A1VL80_POLNA|nr:CvpA family protein [Polaromonas naphthalenivorans]ABM36408.1 Colicin V production protein [Polaromonas naphthalenivorans CJ2]